MRVSPLSFHLCGDSLFKVHAPTAPPIQDLRGLRSAFLFGYADFTIPIMNKSLTNCEQIVNIFKRGKPRAYTLYRHVFTAPRLLCPALAIKKTNRFPLCYYYIESMRFCQAFRELIEKYEYDELHKYQTYGMFQTFQTTHPPVFLPSSLYSSARKLTIGAYIPPAKS